MRRSRFHGVVGRTTLQPGRKGLRVRGKETGSSTKLMGAHIHGEHRAPLVTAILLAAGKSSRMGELKQLLPYGESTVLSTLIACCEASQVNEVLVVLGHEAERIRAAMAPSGRVRFVVNREYERGMLTSVWAGLRAAGDADAYLLVLGDQPGLRTETIDTLLQAYGSQGLGLAVATFGDRRGHPLLIHRRYREVILGLDPQIGLRALLRHHAGEVSQVPTDDPAVLQDLDTREEYQERSRNVAKAA